MNDPTTAVPRNHVQTLCERSCASPEAQERGRRTNLGDSTLALNFRLATQRPNANHPAVPIVEHFQRVIALEQIHQHVLLAGSGG